MGDTLRLSTDSRSCIMTTSDVINVIIVHIVRCQNVATLVSVYNDNLFKLFSTDNFVEF